MQATIWIDNNIFYYEDDNLYFEINVSFKKYWEEKCLNMEFDCQWKAWEEAYPLVFIENKEIYDSESLQNAINNAILYVNNVSDFDISPFEHEKIKEFSEQMATLYGL